MAELGEFDGLVINVLHLTDLHFKDTDSQDEQVERDAVTTSLLDSIDGRRHIFDDDGDLIDDWTPDLICVSGDIAYSGASEDYELAAAFFEKLLGRLELGPERVVACPGNHDRLLDDADGLYATTTEQSDQQLSLDTMRKAVNPNRATPAVLAPFAPFAAFCRKLGFAKPEGIAGAEYLTGTCEHRLEGKSAVVRTMVVNSAWYARRDTDSRKLWIGLKLIEAMDHERKESPSEETTVRIGLCHHPRHWLHEDEHDGYEPTRTNTYKLLTEQLDVLLHGHVHSALEAPSRPYNQAQTFTGGASYAGGRFRNNYSFLQLDLMDNSIRRRGFEYDPRSKVWEEVDSAAGTVELTVEGGPDQPIPPARDVADLAGSWRSVFWQEDVASARKPDDPVDLVKDRDDPRYGPWFKTPDWDDQDPLDVAGPSDERRISLKGKLERGYFTGTWKDRSGVKEDNSGSRFGSFQLKVTSRERMEGRWVGFDSNDAVLAGRWRLQRRGE